MSLSEAVLVFVWFILDLTQYIYIHRFSILPLTFKYLEQEAKLYI